FVGANGCGKTTITKLIAGLYDDYEGQILINGTDIREWGPGRIAGFFSIVYQDFARYGLSLYENIAIGDVEKLCGDEINLVRFQDVVDMMELGEIVSDLKHGMETKLGKIVRDSEDLSGGQWQRVAIARCLVSDRPVKILDEPTAALDPAAESALYEKFRIINQKYTSVTISHRLASARQTDVIFVIENGRVSGSGSHETLYRENRLYREMYDSQRSWYQG
ncbi:MAG: ATP-binding cassette domain-containing protein, partial [Pilosibacter sp.]